MANGNNHKDGACYQEGERGVTHHGHGGQRAVARRDFLRFGLGAAVAGALLTPEEAHAVMRAPARQIYLHNTHTGEQIKAEYWVKGNYVRSTLKALDRVLRDHHNGSVHPMDPRLLDQIFLLTRTVRQHGPVQVISGYRSPETNAMLREEDGTGVAQHSFHMQGKAVDIYVPGMPLKYLRRAALNLKAGGVGYYPHSNFIHIDTGPIRHW
jgi:uncharacterized protein YcbK (DUF882 family)